MIPIIFTSLVFAAGDFPICEAENVQSYPDVIFAESLYYVFWTDHRYISQEKYCIYGARVTTSGTVLDPDGKLLYSNQADTKPSAAYDGTNLLVVFQDSC